MSSSHVAPVYPEAQEQLNPFSRSMQVPPFAHLGNPAHSFTSWSQLAPAYPELPQSQVYPALDPESSAHTVPCWQGLAAHPPLIWVAHRSPVHPAAHEHEYPPSPSTQEAPFAHAWPPQSSGLTAQCSPYQPCVQLQV